jgi:hypothetical protein
MAAVWIDDLTPAHRRVFVDSHRWDAVVGDFVGNTGVGSAAAHMSTLGGSPGPVLIRSSTLRVDVTDLPSGGHGVVVLHYLSDHGYLQKAQVPVDHTGTSTATLRACAVGCAPVNLTLSGAAFTVGSVQAGPTQLLGATSYAGGQPQRALTVAAGSAAIPALTTSGIGTPTRVEGIDGTSRSVRVVGSVGAVPFLGRAGVLLDLGQVLRGSVGTVTVAHAVVVARADTPAAVLARLHHDGGGSATTYDAVASRLDHTPQARGDQLALLVAIGVALVALTHLIAWLSGQVGRRRAEVAGLRVAGLPPRTVRRAYLVEAALLAGIVLVTAAVAAAATTVPLLEPMRLVGGWADAPAARLGVRPMTLTAVVVGVAVVTAVLCAVVFTRFGRSARPSALRSADR